MGAFNNNNNKNKKLKKKNNERPWTLKKHKEKNMLPLELSEKLTLNKVIVVEDMESAPGRGYILAKALFNIQNERTSGAEVFTEISPFQTNGQECVLVDSIKDLIVKSENVKDSIFIHSL